jgi:hypothetical protein
MIKSILQNLPEREVKDPDVGRWLVSLKKIEKTKFHGLLLESGARGDVSNKGRVVFKIFGPAVQIQR